MNRTLHAGLALLGALCLTALVSARQATPADAVAGTPVADAAMRGDAGTVKSLLARGADVNSAQADGMTALHWAALNDDPALATMLLYAGADANAATRIGGYTPLDIAAKDGHADLVKVLLAGGADAKRADVHGTTPLMLAAASGNVAAVTALLEAGADVNAREQVKGETALMLAAAYDRAGAIQVLMAHGADWRPATKVFDWTKLPKNDPRFVSVGAKPIDNALYSSYARLVRTQGGLTALLFAARHGYADAVDALLAGGADLNQVDPGDHTSPLLIAIINGYFDLAKALLDHGADPNIAQRGNGVTPLYAVLNCEWAPKVDYPQPTAYEQQKTGYLDLMADLLAHGANPNARLTGKVWYTGYDFGHPGYDETGSTPFLRAADAADVAAMKLLVAHGADPAIATITPREKPRFQDAKAAATTDHSGLPAVPVGGPDVTPLLAASGEGYGWSLVATQHRFAPTGALAAVKYLVGGLHVDVNARDAAGNTALHNAASRGDDAMILYLVSHGADIKAVNRNGQTVADMANGPYQRVSPFPRTIALAERLGARLVHKCVSCG